MNSLQKMIFQISKLPGIGEKTATRLAYYILRLPEHAVKELSSSILDAKQNTKLCKQCFHFTEEELCSLCSDSKRNAQILCVVEKPSDVHAMENSRVHMGLYHVLHGVLSPLDGVGPDDLKIAELLERCDQENQNIEEVILATNSSVEGEATAHYLSKLLVSRKIKVTKLAYGLPVGGQLEFTDRYTLSRALQHRTEVEL